MNRFSFFRITHLYFILFCLYISLFACGSSTPKEPAKAPEVPIGQDSIDKIRKEIHADQKAAKIKEAFALRVKEAKFNGCVLVAQRGQVIFSNAYGYSNLKTKTPLKLNSAFQLASISKTLTSAAILLLKDQGKLKLTDSIQQYFPNFPFHNITIKLLLSHRSGLSNYVYFGEPYCDSKNCYNGKTFDNAAVMQIMMDAKPPVYAAPNKKFEYCNTNFAILASIVEKVSGMKFADFMKQNIFVPLGMNDTWIHDPKTDSQHPNITLGHTAGGKFVEEKFADDVIGDKGVYSTVEDMLKWDQALYSEKLLKKETIAEAFTGYSNEHKGKRNYGYGWRMIDDGKNPKIIYHNGWWHGYATLFFRRPSDQTTVIILSNKFGGGTYHIEDILSILNENSQPVDIDGEE
ncbi:MAG: serine hydrolase domain-containing protein [Bacteroidia bacterium]